MTIKAWADPAIPGRGAPITRRSQRGAMVAVAFGAALWGVVPLLFLAARAHRDGTVFTGADGPFSADQLQYLAWIRDASRHVLASDLFTFHGGGHVLLHPMFALSGLLVRLGVPIQAAYLVWLPVATAILVVGALGYVRRTLPSGSWQQPAALALALLFATPTLLVASRLPAGAVRAYAQDATGELFTSGELVGYFPAAIALGLMALYFLALEGVTDSVRWKRAAFVAAALGLFVAWLHPWQGAVVAVATCAFAAWTRRRRPVVRLAIPLAGTAAPLVYFAVLARLDAGWRISAAPGRGLSAAALAAVALAIGPLAVPACAGLRMRPVTTRDRLLWLWPAATLVVYTVGPPYAGRALPGVSIPLAVLAIRGWRRLAPTLAALGVAVLVFPGMVSGANSLRTAYRRPAAGYELTTAQQHLLHRLGAIPAEGGALAPPPLAGAVPAFSGRAVWAGHLTWTPAFYRRERVVQALYGGTLSPAAGQRAVRSTGARFVVSDCSTTARFRDYLPAGTEVVAREGCVTLYRLP